MKNFPFISASQAITLLRIAVSLFLMAHGIIRTYLGTVGGFGVFELERIYDRGNTCLGNNLF